MKPFSRIVAALGLIAVAIAISASGQDASNAHYVIINNSDISGNNYGTVMKLAGTTKNPTLNIAATLDPNEPGGGTGDAGNDPQVQVARHGSDICIFLKDEIDSSGANEVSAYKYPGLVLVANYTDSNVPNSYYPYAIVASGDYLFVVVGKYISSWAIESGCTLSLLQTTPVVTGSINLAATPDGKTLVGSNDGSVDSYAIGPNGTLTERGPYDTNGRALGLDITADSQYAIFAAFPLCLPNQCTTFVEVITINPDGSLGKEQDFGGDGSLGNAEGIGFVHLSPNEKFLYSSGGTGKTNQIITFNFSENPVNITYTGCTTNLRTVSGPIAWTLATAETTGAGGGLYVAEGNTFDGQGSVGLLTINAATGCTTEAPSSPFSLADNNAGATSLVAWPPRPF